MSNRRDLAGLVFGKLRVIAFAGVGAGHNPKWECQCECGNLTIVFGANLARRNTTSCGCFRRSKRVANPIQGHPDYSVFRSMMARCFNKNLSQYHYYGGRGITVCDRWMSGGFWVFNSDMGDRPALDYTLDRIDSNGNYEPSNCRWATRVQQGRNKRNNRLLVYQGRTLPLSEWAEILKMSESIIDSRIRRGWSVEKCFETPVDTRFGSHQRRHPDDNTGDQE